MRAKVENIKMRNKENTEKKTCSNLIILKGILLKPSAHFFSIRVTLEYLSC